MPTQLHCPWCQAPGISQIGLYSAQPQVVLTYCRACLSIRGVLPHTGSLRTGQEELRLRCPYCQGVGTSAIKVAALKKGWVVVYCQGCGTVHGLTPLLEDQAAQNLPPPAVQSSAEPLPLGDASLWAEIGQADLAAKRAQYEAELTRRAMMVRGGATLYRTIAHDDGPPYCLTCRRNMEAQLVPPGYKNSGQKIWLCPGGCGAWEAG